MIRIARLPVLGLVSRVRWSAALSWTLVLACLLASVAAPPAAGAQPTDEEGSDEAALALQDYLVPDEVLPPGWTLDVMHAYTNEAQALEYGELDPPDPRPTEALLQQLQESGRVVLLRQLFVQADAAPEDAVEVRFSVGLFRTAQGAARAIQDPSLMGFVPQYFQVTRQDAPTIGDGAAGFRLTEVDEDGEVLFRANQVIWQRGRLAFLMSVQGEDPEVVDAARGMGGDLARALDAWVAGRPSLPTTVGSPQAYLPSTQERLRLYRALIGRLLPVDVFPELNHYGVDTVTNAEAINDASLADAPVDTPSAAYDRMVRAERRILGVGRNWETPEESGTPLGTRFPELGVAYTLYADADGAREALAASVAELGLRAFEEISPTATGYREIAPLLTLGDQTRAVMSSYTFPDGVEIDVYSVRWRRGAVELSAGLAVAAGSDPTQLWTLARRHDAAYTANPLVQPAAPPVPAATPAPAVRPPAAPAQAPVQVPGR